MSDQQQQRAMRVVVPSPLVGEGCSAGRQGLDRVRGSLSTLPMRRRPLTRLRFAKPPSPTKGEGAATFLCFVSRKST